MKRLLTSLILLSAALSAAAEDGVIETPHWTQMSPYNDLVPAYLAAGTGDVEALGGHVPAGCVATQMAQIMKFWGWPRRFESKVSSTHHVALSPIYDGKGNIIGYKNEFYVENEVAQGVTILDDKEESPTRFTFIAATLAGLQFNRDGTGGRPEKIIEKLINSELYDQPVYAANDNSARWDRANELIRAGYPLPANFPGHAVVIDGWKRENMVEKYHLNYGYGSGYAKDTWYERSAFENKGVNAVFPIFPKKKAILKKLPTYSKLPLKIEWIFPDGYKKVYPKEFEGFDLVVIPNKGKSWDPIKLGRDDYSYTFDKLDNEQQYEFKITPRFNLSEDDPTYYFKPEEDSAFTTINVIKAFDVPYLSAPEKFDASLTGCSFKLTGSKSISSLALTTSLKSYKKGNTTYQLSDYVTIEGKEGDYTVRINKIDFLGGSDNYNVVFTFSGDDANGATAYAETIVNFAAENKGTVPTDPITPHGKIPKVLFR